VVNFELVGEMAAHHRLPASFPARRGVAEGGLMTYGPRYADIQRRAAEYVDRILRGDRPGDLPVEYVTHYQLVLNQRTAREMGLRLTPAFLARVDELIE
jgi:putative ABC transport system substrate-binding protein